MSEGQLNYCGFYKEELLLKTIKDREICQIYLFPYENHLKLKINEEVTDVVQIELEDFLSMISKKSPNLQAESIFTGEQIPLSYSDFCPHHFDYYQSVVQAILSSR
ncbi:hypothetical protein MUO14_14220 [Halobacillus shinanisalinarum]|uniref:Uncharacterized protein n=1 Tax=Halobacillus shinanisalinarum TaxID=2932258 RepID=A0ABY4GUS5_9BACI|nr:hypothetical protein [Halobacillus shinanisalinarum]UOQ91701.1 hypothetical protein MUO14_14220 [Halobacillus shinanisalinarum]